MCCVTCRVMCVVRCVVRVASCVLGASRAALFVVDRVLCVAT